MGKRGDRRAPDYNPYTVRMDFTDIARRAARNLRRHKKRCRDCTKIMPCLVALQYADDLLSTRRWIAEDTPEGAEVRGEASALELAS